MAHQSRRARQALTVALASALGALAPITLDRLGPVWQVADAASGKAAGAGAYGPRGGDAAPRSESPRPGGAGGAGAIGGGAGGNGPGQGGDNGGAPGRGSTGAGASSGGAPAPSGPGRGAAGGGAPSGEGPGPGAAGGGAGAVGDGAGTSDRGTSARDRDVGPAGSPADARGDDRKAGARVAPVRRTGGDLARELEQIGDDLSPAEEAALIADRWR